MSTRLSRKEMKTDEVREVLDHLLLGLRDHWLKVVLALGAVIVVGLAIWGSTVVLSSRETRAQQDLVAALRVLEAQIDTVDPQPNADPPTFATEAERSRVARERFEALIESHSSSDAARVARACLAAMHANDGDLPAAEALWTELEEEGGADTLAAATLMNLITARRSGGQLEELASDLRARLESGDRAIPQDALLHELGTTLESLDRNAEAETIYQRLVDEHPASPFALEARQKLAPAS